MMILKQIQPSVCHLIPIKNEDPHLWRGPCFLVYQRKTSPLYVPTRTRVSLPIDPLSRIEQCTANTDSWFKVETTSLQSCESVISTSFGSFDSVICKFLEGKRNMLLISESKNFDLKERKYLYKVDPDFIHPNRVSTDYHKYYEQCTLSVGRRLIQKNMSVGLCSFNSLEC